MLLLTNHDTIDAVDCEPLLGTTAAVPSATPLTTVDLQHGYRPRGSTDRGQATLSGACRHA